MPTKTTSRQYKSVDEYIASFPAEVKDRMQKIRATIKKAAPSAEELISYGIAGYKLNGVLIYFAGFKNHIGLYPVPRTDTAFEKELSTYKGGKGTAQFPHDKRLPIGLITKIVKYRKQINEAKKNSKK